MKILAISGSLKAGSENARLLEVARASAPPGVGVVLFDGLRHLPHFDPDLETNAPAPSPVRAWRRALAESDAILLACPEYGHSLPGVLKNGIDWVVGSGELEGKVVAITASVPAPERGLLGLAALRQTLGAVRARIVGGDPIARGPSFETEVAALLHSLISEVERNAVEPS